MTSALVFQNTTFDIIDRLGMPWLRLHQIGVALEYSRPDAVNKIYQSNADEFTDQMTAVVELDTAGGKQKTRIFSLRGAHLLAMLARTQVAKEFRKWVLDVLDRISATRQSAQSPATPPINAHLSLRDAVHAVAKGNRQHYSAIYKRLYRRYRVNSYLDIPAEQCGHAIEYIRSLDGEYIPREKMTAPSPALALPDGQHYVVAKDGVVLYHKVLSHAVGQDAMPGGNGMALDHVAATNIKTVLNQAVIFSEMWRNNLRPMLQAAQSPLLAQVGDGVSVMGFLAKMLVNQHGGGSFDLSTGKSMAVQAR